MSELELVSTNIEVKTPAAFTVNPEKILAIKTQYPIADVPAFVETKEDYDLCKAGEKAYKTARLALVAEHKVFKAPVLKVGRELDAAKNEGIAALAPGEEAYKAPRVAFDTAKEIAKREAAAKEEARVDEIASNIASIKALVESNISADSDTINDIVMGLRDEKPLEWADEFCEKAEKVIVDVTEKLIELYNMKLQTEQAAKIAAENEAKLQAQQENERKERESEQARIAAENKKLADKLAADQAEIQAEKDKLAAQQKEVADAAAKAEQDKKDAEVAAQKVVDDKVAADKAEAERVEAESKSELERARLIEIGRLKAEKAKADRDKNIQECARQIDVVYDGDTKGLVACIIKGEIDHIVWVD